jgi:hypothetical protein
VVVVQKVKRFWSASLPSLKELRQGLLKIL